MNKTNRKKNKQSNAEKPISLKPLKFDEAVSDLLKVKPDTKKTKTDKANTDKEFNMSEGKETSNQRIRNKPSTREVIREFLKREGKTVTYDEIYNYTVSKVRLTTKTPRNSIYSVLIRMDDVKHVGTGQYKFKGK